MLKSDSDGTEIAGADINIQHSLLSFGNRLLFFWKNSNDLSIVVYGNVNFKQFFKQKQRGSCLEPIFAAKT